MKNKILILFLILGNILAYAQCTVNAGGNATICGTTYILDGGASAGATGTPTWSLVSKPSGATDPTISNINAYKPNVTGLNSPGNYVFKISQTCNDSSIVTSQVTITAPGENTGFTAGPDITNITAATGIANLSATIPAGYTPSWTYYNLNSFEYNASVVTTNATMTGTTTATPTLTLTKKADHDIDPSYRVILRITSTVNPSCWYEDDAIVRFIPNPNVSYPNSRIFCGSPSASPNIRYFYDGNPSSPQFSDNTTNASANPSWGTTITMNVISQPAGGNLAYDRMQNGRLYFASSFNQTVGAYVFTLTISNSSGSYTTQQLTFNYNGSTPAPLSFVDAAYPEQMALYSAGASGGAVYCNRAGTTTPITINFKLDPVDSPTLTSTVIPSGIIPTGGAPAIVISGAGTMNRIATLTPPSGGWRVGTYNFSVIVSNGTCTRSHSYYVHISDGNRPNVVVNDMTVCYSGTGVVSATIPLPAVYKGVVNSSYFQNYSGRYEFTVVSKPAGSATPTFDPVASRTFTNTSTVISNLNTQGEYIFKIKATPPPGGDPGFISKEYLCSGTSDEDTFSVFVSAQVGANAGSSQNITTSTATLNGNNPTPATGTWTLVAKPTGAADPLIVTPSAYNTNVTGLVTGTYTFRWTIATGNCIDKSDVNITVSLPEPCFEPVNGADFQWSTQSSTGFPPANPVGGVITKTITQPAANYGYTFDIYQLDNSFNMKINGVDLATQEIDFQLGNGGNQNVEFLDGMRWSAAGSGIGGIWTILGDRTSNKPIIRVNIAPNGQVTMLASRKSANDAAYLLEPIRFFGGTTFNIINWNPSSINTVVVNQNVIQITTLDGTGYGRNIIPCACYNDPKTGGFNNDTKVGITLLKRAGAQNADNWPMVRKSGHIALESNTQGFVVTRMTTAQLTAIKTANNAVEGMMSYDTDAKCLKIYDGTDWKCFNTPSCP